MCGFVIGVPELDLRAVSQVDARVAASGHEFPVDVHLKVSVVAVGDEVWAFAVADELAILDAPVFLDLLLFLDVVCVPSVVVEG